MTHFASRSENRLPVKQWHHVLAVFDSLEPYDKVRIYVDGQQQTLKVNNSRLFRQFSNGAAHLRIGGGGGDEWLFKGMIDEVRIYKALPSAEQIADSVVPRFTFPNRGDSTGKCAREAQRLKIRNAFLEAGSICRQRVGHGLDCASSNVRKPLSKLPSQQ